MEGRGQLTVLDIRGPYTELLRKLDGDDGRVWLEALKLFLAKQNPWQEDFTPKQFREHTRLLVGKQKQKGKLNDALTELAVILQQEFSPPNRHGGEYGWGLDYLMRAVTAVLQGPKDRSMSDYIRNKLENGVKGINEKLPTNPPSSSMQDVLVSWDE